MKKTSMFTLLALTFIVASMFFVQPAAPTIYNDLGTTEAPVLGFMTSGFDSDNMSVILVSPANQSTVSGTFNISLSITSVNSPLNLTLFIEDAIYPDYNFTSIPSGIQNFTIDSTTLAEGTLNFTFLFEDNTYGTFDKESYTVVFTVNNHGAPQVVILAPTALSNFTGLDHLYLNITSDYTEVYLNITVDDEITEEYNATLVPVGLGNYTINGTRYENGVHTVKAIVYTEEGLSASKSIELYFLKYVRLLLRGIANYDSIAGNKTFQLKTESPYSTLMVSAYVDGVLAPDVINVSIPVGDSSVILDTTPYSEGEHQFLFIAYDGFGHYYQQLITLVVDNHGIPTIKIISPTDDIIAGTVTFSVNITTTWSQVNVTVYVDGAEVANYTNVDAGVFTFTLDTSAYTKWQHTVKIVVETLEGESTQIEETYGFANMKLEEMASLAVLLGLAIVIPFLRKRNGYPLRPVLIADIVFVAAVAAGFMILGVTKLSQALWHVNLASIWILGGILVFVNWSMPFITGETSKK